MPTHKKYTLLKNAAANAKGNFFKRVFFSPPKKSTLPFFKNLFFPPHGFTSYTTTCAFNVTRLGQSVYGLQMTLLRTDRRASANCTYKKLAVRWLNVALCFVSSLVLADSLVLRIRQLLVAVNRYQQIQ